MYRYSPPKSNIWGHKLGKMAADRQKQLLDEFFRLAVAEHSFGNGSVSIPKVTWQGEPLHNAFTHLIQRFERELGGRSDPSHFGVYDLTESQFNQCFAQLLDAGALDSANPACARLTCLIAISKWRLNGREVPTGSMMHIHYGPLPCISTFFNFETMNDFYIVQNILSELKICNLSEKHLKLDKRKLARSSERKKSGPNPSDDGTA